VSGVLDMDATVLPAIQAARPDILLVAFGNPKQEKWIGMYKRQLGVPVMMGVGGSLDFIAGLTQRAPGWMQHSGLEWVFRLVQQPGRLWRRYLGDLFVFGPFFLRQWWLMRQGNAYSRMLPAADLMLTGRAAIIRVSGSLTIANYSDFNRLVEQALAATANILVDMAELRFMDSAAIGSLVHFAKRAREAGGELALAQVPPAIVTALSMLHLLEFLNVHPTLEAALGALSAAPRPEAPAAVLAPAQLGAGQWMVVKGVRRFDAAAAPEMTQVVVEALGLHHYVILDLSETVILTSAGLSALAHLNRVAQEQHGALRVTGCSTDVMQVIRMVRFDKVLSLYRDVRSAAA
jgi:N-acetylglucosaminyldiphosphoundecaprenol N-acetyl-beta-D-mannosaminyltransferase